ncbi:MAG: EpsI family protein, partial [Burkholderiaceae bacterium]|nr:EpsI family protein [Burkholderiaceae bacterium]
MNNLSIDRERRPQARIADGKAQSIQLIAAAVVILGAAVLTKVLEPRELMARGATAPTLDQAIPRQFGPWRMVPGAGLLVPADPDVQPDADSTTIYSQEVARQYTDGQGNIVMLMVAYGSVQNYQLKAHRPELCYTAAGFRVSSTQTAWLDYRAGAAPLKVTRLTAERESRFEPITYWMRVGNDVTSGIVDRQWARLKYGLRGLIPDGALIRISTVGLSGEASFALQDRFMRDLLAAV